MGINFYPPSSRIIYQVQSTIKIFGVNLWMHGFNPIKTLCSMILLIDGIIFLSPPLTTMHPNLKPDGGLVHEKMQSTNKFHFFLQAVGK
jgi:hypothetical protein